MGITEVTGVIAVVVSVLYLGLQIRDNTKVLRSQAHYNALSLAQRPMEMMIENESLANVVNRSYADADAVSADEWARFGNYAFIGFNAWEYLYYQHRDKAIPKELWVGADRGGSFSRVERYGRAGPRCQGLSALPLLGRQ